MLPVRPQLLVTEGPHTPAQHKLPLLGQSCLFAWDKLCPRLKRKQTHSPPDDSTLGTETFCSGKMLRLSPSVSLSFLLIALMPGEGDRLRCGIISFSTRAELHKEVHTFEPSSPGFRVLSPAPLGGILMTARLLLLQCPAQSGSKGQAQGHLLQSNLFPH